jgi:hypothetical protein
MRNLTDLLKNALQTLGLNHEERRIPCGDVEHGKYLAEMPLLEWMTDIGFVSKAEVDEARRGASVIISARVTSEISAKRGFHLAKIQMHEAEELQVCHQMEDPIVIRIRLNLFPPDHLHRRLVLDTHDGVRPIRSTQTVGRNELRGIGCNARLSCETQHYRLLTHLGWGHTWPMICFRE